MKDQLKKKLFDEKGNFKDRSTRYLSEDLRNAVLAAGPEGCGISEAVYWVMNDLTAYPKLCKACSNPIKKFVSFNQGYVADYCSGKCSNSSKDVQEKKKIASREKYGTDFPWQHKDVKKVISQKQQLRNFVKAPTIREEVEQQGFQLISWDNSKMDNPATLRCNQNHEFERQLEGWRRWNVTCPKCSNGRSKAEVAVESFIESLGFTVQDTGKRSILTDGKELDIVVPSKKLAIEFNGMYHHSSDQKNDRVNRLRHVSKQDMAEDLGFTLLQIWESEWLDKQEIVKSRISQALGVSKRIFARKCLVVEVTGSQSREFLSENHIQGPCLSSVNLGLSLDGKLVALMTFAKPRFSKKAQWELLRFCTLRGTTVVGGASKLLSAFKQRHDPESILSYADRRWSKGNLYRQLGMTQVGKPTAGYWYWKQGEGLHHRMGFQKHRLERKLRYFDASKTEEENMLMNGYRVIWDCGHLQFIWKKGDSTTVDHSKQD